MKLQVWSVSSDYDDGTCETWLEIVMPEINVVIQGDLDGKGVEAFSPLNNYINHYVDKNYDKTFYYEYLGEL